jgi:hypothetical protein
MSVNQTTERGNACQESTPEPFLLTFRFTKAASGCFPLSAHQVDKLKRKKKPQAAAMEKRMRNRVIDCGLRKNHSSFYFQVFCLA